MYMIIKRASDIFLSLAGIVVLLPLFIIIAVIIKLESKGPVLFKQKRVGLNKVYLHGDKFYTGKNAPE